MVPRVAVARRRGLPAAAPRLAGLLEREAAVLAVEAGRGDGAAGSADAAPAAARGVHGRQRGRRGDRVQRG